jgi:hypothetical protein
MICSISNRCSLQFPIAIRHIKDELMNLSTTAYNPFYSAAQAAIAELMSDQAQRYYAIKGQKDVQNALDNALTLIGWVYQLSELIYHLGALSRDWCDQMVAASEQLTISSSYVLCPAAAPVALLPAALPKSIRLPGALASSGVAIVTPAPAETAPVSVTQPSEHCLPQAPVIDAQATGAETIALPQSASKPRQRRAPSGKQKAPTAPARSRRKLA